MIIELEAQRVLADKENTKDDEEDKKKNSECN